MPSLGTEMLVLHRVLYLLSVSKSRASLGSSGVRVTLMESSRIHVCSAPAVWDTHTHTHTHTRAHTRTRTHVDPWPPLFLLPTIVTGYPKLLSALRSREGEEGRTGELNPLPPISPSSEFLPSSCCWEHWAGFPLQQTQHSNASSCDLACGAGCVLSYPIKSKGPAAFKDLTSSPRDLGCR